MRSYRIEIRVFGLLVFALVSSLLLALGLETAGAQGEIAGVSFTVAGPVAAFIIMTLIFYQTGLFKLGLEDKIDNDLNHPIESMSIEDIDNMIDKLDMNIKRIGRHRQKLLTAKNALENNASEEEALIASGITPVSRPHN